MYVLAHFYLHDQIKSTLIFVSLNKQCGKIRKLVYILLLHAIFKQRLKLIPKSNKRSQLFLKAVTTYTSRLKFRLHSEILFIL
jgi:hypothetical protein